ncbi:hypothetical protein D0469_01905 [Peribacillus saganii]|uniref:Magnesium transporter MgtE intracellular domain-containing protein n=1 Tax=Peribacillus saganii TaxID=2303992 RepID=A0A372LSX9_9BACI|nr:MotE family protein [Peribacillus saganii]RFU71288.1 hypothetical protein D0469_01905 [Peribacillus saganii]
MDKTLENEEKPYSKLQWFLFIVVIPLFFTITITLIVLTVAGINVFEAGKEYGQKIPFASALFKEEEATKSTEDLEKRIIDLKAEMEDRQAQIEKLEGLIDSRDKEAERAELEKQQLEKEIAELTAVKDENKLAFKDIIQTYETMAPKKSAPIISELKEEDALKILSTISSDTLASILEQMEPADAARLTQKLTVQSEQDRNSAD